MEHIVASQIMSHLNKNNLLFDYQHGFRSKLSTETQLLEFTTNMINGMRDGKQNDVVIMDFAKAFDKVSHQKLLFKLRKYGIDETTCGWAESFLLNRTQRVVVDGEHSEIGHVTSGVPQGSVVGPIFFLIYINDMPDYTKHSTLRLFADNTIIYLSVESKGDCTKLQADLAALEKWGLDWQMEFHPSKCFVMRVTRKKKLIKFPYSLQGQVLSDTKATKYLGVTLSEDITWNKHIDSITSKANRQLGFIKRNLKIKNQDLKTKAYKAYVRPTLEYCCSVWDPSQQKQIDQLEMVQRRAARWVLSDYGPQSSVSKMLQQLHWQELAYRRQHQRLLLLYKIIHSLVLIKRDQYLRVQRNGIHIQNIHATQQYHQMSFFPRTIREWNSLPDKVLKAPTLDSFKSGLMRCPLN